MLAKKHANIADLQFSQKIHVYKSNGEFHRAFSETLSLIGTDTSFIRLLDENGEELASHSRKLTGPNAGVLGRPTLYDLLMIRDEGAIFEHLKLRGLPLKNETELYSEKEGSLPYKPESTVALTRHENRVAITIGSERQAKDQQMPKAPQLWVEKDSYLPLRAVMPSAPESGFSSEPLDFRFSQYQVYGNPKSFLYPKSIQVMRDGRLWLRIETLSVKALDSKTHPTSRVKSDIDGNTRDFIATYLKWIR
ncbi:MAG: hypothetical protein AB1540_14300 [Bdellovibrionota bacterium]